MVTTVIRVPDWVGWFVLALVVVAALAGRSRGAAPPPAEIPAPMPAPKPAPKDDVEVVYVESKADGDVMEWTYTGNGRRVTFEWTVKGGKASEELAAHLVKEKLCSAGRCPLLPVRVRLVPRRKFD